VRDVEFTNPGVARALSFAVEASGKPRHQVAREAGMHRETLRTVMRGERPIAVDEASHILTTCGAHPKATLLLTMAGHEDLACQWMRNEMGQFLEEFLAVLPMHLDRTLGRRVADLRPRWANGTSQLVARMLSKHIDEFTDRDFAATIGR
jgi:antitoxin HigA-1